MRKRNLFLFLAMCVCPLSGCIFDFEETVDSSLSLNYSDVKVQLGQTFQLNASLLNCNGDVIWQSSNESIATVNESGLVTFTSDEANIGKTVTIFAKLKSDNSIYNSCLFTLNQATEVTSDYTIMYYMCASTLEYDPDYDNPRSEYYKEPQPYLFTEDIKEILSVKNMPDSVNILIETGGTTKWSTELGIRNDKLQRWQVKDGELKLIETLNTNQMATSTSLQSFLDWGLTNYSAKQMGLVISGHGGGIGGCAFDDNYTYKYFTESYSHYLDTSEVATAVKNALANHGRDKFTWIGYDCCLMQCADIASINAKYFDYMVASQEEEDGYGWDHDSYLGYLYANPNITPEEFLPHIASTFVDSIEVYCHTVDYDYEYCYSTLSVLNLKKMENFVTSFNNYVNAAGTSKNSYGKFKTAFTNSLNRFGGKCYGLCDMKDYIIKLSSQFPGVSTSAMTNALNELIIANYYCDGYGSTKPCGINAFLPVSLDRDYELQPSKDDYQGSLSTEFSAYQSMCLSYGSWAW